MRRLGVWILVLMLTASLWAPVQAQSDQVEKEVTPEAQVPLIVDANGDKVMDDLAARMATAGAQDSVNVIVVFSQPASAAAYQAVEKAAGQIAYRAQWDLALQGFAASLTPGQIKALQRLPVVSQIDLDRPVQAFLGGAHPWTGVNKARTDYGVDGSRDSSSTSYSTTDVVVAILDTGIDAAHVDLDAGKVLGWRDEINGRTSPYDDHGHGTHVASIVAGTGEGNGVDKGVAPGAGLVGIKVLDGNGSGTTTGIINGINWMIANKDTYKIRAANMSLGSSGCSDGTDSLSTAVNNAVDKGIIMVVAAGNSGPAKCTIGSPAAAAKAITVGASYDPAEKGWALAEFSSRGPTYDGRVKPDIVAPGRYINAAKANSSNGYVIYSGTSMATPYAAGVVALMLDANYALTDSNVKTILYGSGNYEDWGPAGKEIDYGYGMLLAYNAVKSAAGGTGSFEDGIGHGYASGSLSGTGDADLYSISVSDTTKPLAVTFMIPDHACRGAKCSPDFDIYLYNPSGNLVAQSIGTKRQEWILIYPSTTGTWTLRVYSYSGSGSYFFDVSAK
ncbi:MAG: S8 family serine peptidase [Bacillota bacterium]